MLANMDSDYLIVASENLLLERGRTCDNLRTEDVKELVLLYLNQLLLKEVTVLQRCRSLRICNLSNNFITNINSLRACSHLIKLDLSGNQIQKLPDRAFWNELKELKLMYLHDNQIGDVSNIESLSSCPNLTALTLYDTPLSLRKSYRHIVVNSIWSLKALDNYVVSDEEIIEDWSLQYRFRSQNPHLCINMLPAPCTDICLQSEMKDVRDLFTKINHVLVHCSPVLIIQRWIRGFLTRKRLGIISPVKIQKKKIHILRSPRKEDDIDGIHVTKILIQDFSALPFSSDSKTLPVIKQGIECVNDASDPGIKRITVDLRKLQKNVLQQVLPDAAINCDLESKLTAPKIEVFKEDNKIKEIKAINPISSPKKDHTEPGTKENDNTQFRLLGLSSTVYESDGSKELLAANEESARDIRESIQLFHSTVQDKAQLAHRVKTLKQSSSSLETGDAMKMQPLYAVDKAYENRQKYDIQMKKRNLVMQVYNNKIQAKSNVQGFHEEKRKHVKEQNEKDSIIFQQDIEQNQLTRLNFIKTAKQRQKQFSQEKQQKASEHSFVKEFNAQHTSVSNTLLKHDRMLKSGAKTKEKIRFVQSLKENEEKQKSLLKSLKEHRRLTLQIENSAEKEALNSVVLENALDRLQEACGHVASIKVQQVTAAPMFKIPVNQPVSKTMCNI
ncbi:leucine-rich repeat and IQ domain-containing protein 3 [Pelobates fuscus]|uniref:leucine-rich repeat and IQ domain-containing protein 3 n=1 Tax=Pelobates fuscus TaxID=191477 RepID=UPI002FE4CCC1